MRVLVAVTLLVALSGCAAQQGGVRCSGRLEPINAPAPRVTAIPASGARSSPLAPQGPIGGTAP